MVFKYLKLQMGATIKSILPSPNEKCKVFTPCTVLFYAYYVSLLHIFYSYTG